MTSDNAESRDSAIWWVAVVQKINSTEEKFTINKTIGPHLIASVSPINEETSDQRQTPDSGHACPLGGRAMNHSKIL